MEKEQSSNLINHNTGHAKLALKLNSQTKTNHKNVEIQPVENQ
jgi:hypothetical protein